MIPVFLSLLTLATTGFADNIVFENQTPYPNKDQKTKMAIQWAASAKEVDGHDERIDVSFEIKQ